MAGYYKAVRADNHCKFYCLPFINPEVQHDYRLVVMLSDRIHEVQGSPSPLGLRACTDEHLTRRQARYNHHVFRHIVSRHRPH